MFKPTKIGLLNFWLYDDEEFQFFDGKLLLRGENGSGKSVTMQSFIPLILDGNKSPKRLDTFGSSDKHIEYYLLGENNEKEDSTGYLYMEFYDEQKDKYVTIGMGLRARVGKNTDFFGFALKDGQRVNHDFYLYKCQDGIHKTPLTKLELKAALGVQNGFVETAKDYKKMVNDLLFQFSSLDSYDEFIQVLIQLRSPKLSKEFKPTKLMSVLNDVLPPLAEEDLRPLSETIESLNQTREKMEDLQAKIKIIGNFVKVFQNYNEAILVQKANQYLQKVNVVEELENKKSEREQTIQASEQDLAQLKVQQKSLEDEYVKAKMEKEQLGNQDLEEKSQRKLVLDQQVQELADKIDHEENNLDVMKQKLAQIKAESQASEKEVADLEKEREQYTMQGLDLGSELSFEPFLTAFSLNEKNFEYLHKLVKEKENEIQNVLTLLEKRQRLLEEQNKESDAFEQLKAQYDLIEKEKENKQVDLENEMELFFQTLRNLANENQYLMVLEEDYREMVGYLEEYSLENYQRALSKYEQLYQNAYNKATMHLATTSSKQEKVLKELELEQEKLTALKNQEEISFAELDLQEEAVEYLNQERIPYLSFYRAVEFQDGLSSEVCNKIEEALYSAGILNAKILNKEDLSKITHYNLSYIVPSTKKKQNLTKYLKPARNTVFDSSYILKILESISINDQDLLWINENDFQFDFLRGQTASKYESKFIGVLLRKKRHEEEINKQELVVQNVQGQLDEIKKELQDIQLTIQGLMEEKVKFPSNTVLEQISKEIQNADLELKFWHEKLGQSEARIREIQKQIETILLDLETSRGDIPLRLDAYQNAYHAVKDLSDVIDALERIEDKISNKKEIIYTQQAREEDISHNYDDTYALVADYLEQKHKCEMELEAIVKLLNTPEYKELSLKLNALLKIIEEYPHKTSEFSKKIGVLEQSILQEEGTLKIEEEQIKQALVYQEIVASIFAEELSLGYVLKDSEASLRVAEQIIRDYKDQEKDLMTANANYYRAFNEYRQELLDYAIQDVQLFHERSTLVKTYTEKGLDEVLVKELYSNAKRQDIVTSYQGKKLSLYALQDALKESYEADKIYLDEQDRHLFEDILLRTIGGKIKEKIIDAQDWVKQINQIMAEKQKDSALSFYLDWKPKSQETLEEMNTKELVEIFMLDEGSVRPGDTERLVKHFQSKIKRAEEFMDENKDSYFDMIFQILDYRNWFTFKLFYRKNQSERKELTDKVFSVFSGGEKAKTMYVPLFASVYAKLDSASLSAPRLIALDEAFAGVDEKNIEEMFAILESFQLDYILTSQALWCDYKEVRDISICELIKAKNASSVAIRRYRWNGKIKEVLN